MNMKINVKDIIEFLIVAYKEELEDNGDLVADQLVANWPGIINKSEYDDENDIIKFDVDIKLYDVLPEQFKNCAKLL